MRTTRASYYAKSAYRESSIQFARAESQRSHTYICPAAVSKTLSLGCEARRCDSSSHCMSRHLSAHTHFLAELA